MPSFSDSIFLFVLALLLFGPKKLPVLARELGKWVGEFRRASNEFKMQMEDELRQSEQAERLKKIEEMEAAAPKVAELPASTEAVGVAEGVVTPPMSEEAAHEWGTQSGETAETEIGVSSEEPAVVEAAAPLPIAEVGEVKIMPPATGLPTARKSGLDAEGRRTNALGGLLESIPAVEKNGAASHIEAGHVDAETAETAHGH